MRDLFRVYVYVRGKTVHNDVDVKTSMRASGNDDVEPHITRGMVIISLT